jgi:carboxynorspermidine decarboxylase
VRPADVGIRINPSVSYSDYDLADPARRYSRLGVSNYSTILDCADLITGAMYHYNCENDDFHNFCNLLDAICEKYEELLLKLKWVSLGGGIDFTSDNYPLDRFAQRLSDFSTDFDIQVYLEPGEAVVSDTTCLMATVLDIVSNEVDTAIVDSSIEAHMLDLLTYQIPARIAGTPRGKFRYLIAGQSCLAGDIFGEARFDSPLRVGDKVRIEDAAGYTMVKTNWFNGLRMPAIVLKKSDGSMVLVKTFSYRDFKHNLG